MSELFFLSKKGLPVCSMDTGTGVPVNLHSIYDPEKEGERFALSLQADFVPKYIIVTGPCISYCAPFIQKRFPAAILIAVQFSDSFDEWNGLWNRIIKVKKPEIFEEELFSIIQDEDMGRALFVSWKPSEKAYPGQYKSVWASIAAVVRKGRDILGTRTYFNHRWAVNSAQFCIAIKKAALPVPGSAPVILAAAGPSLECSLDFIRKYRGTFYIIALAPALLPLYSAGILPDCCVSTDGGYWAKQHLLPLENIQDDIPLFLSAESAVSSPLFETKTIVPLCYGDAPEALFLAACGIPCFPGIRNGTAAGTAALLALSLTDGPVYACGLDLSPSCSWNHARPNILDERDTQTESRLLPLPQILAGAHFSHGALDLYKAWFAANSMQFRHRLFRIRPVPHSIPGITDIPLSDVNPGLFAGRIKPHIHPAPLQSSGERRKKCLALAAAAEHLISETENAEELLSAEAAVWTAAACLPEYVKLKRRIYSGNKEIPEALKAQAKIFFTRIQRRIIDYDR